MFLDPVNQVADAQMYGSWISAVSLLNWYHYLCSFSIKTQVLKPLLTVWLGCSPQHSNVGIGLRLLVSVVKEGTDVVCDLLNSDLE